MSKYDGLGEELLVTTDLGVETVKFPTYSISDVVAVFDLDFIVYSAACMADHTTIEVIKGGKKKVFRNRTEFYAKLKEHNQKVEESKHLFKEDFEIVDIVKPQPISHALRNIKARIEGIMERIGANKAEFYVGGAENFRNYLPLPYLYKGNRKETRRPTHLSACKQYAVNNLGAFSVYGREADDVVTQRAIQIRKQGAEAILIGEDKDAYGTYNIFTFNPKKDFEPFFIGESPEIWSNGFLGEVTSEGSKFKGYGLRWKAYQILTGDSADGYHFKDILKKNLIESGLTPKAASMQIKIKTGQLVRDINSVEDEKALWTLVLDHAKQVYGTEPVCYIDHFGRLQQTDYIGVLNLYYHCVHMRLSMHDDNTIYTILRKFGLYEGDFNPEIEVCYVNLQEQQG